MLFCLSALAANLATFRLNSLDKDLVDAKEILEMPPDWTERFQRTQQLPRGGAMKLNQYTGEANKLRLL